MTEPVAPSMLRGSTVPERVTMAAVSVFEAEVVEDEEDVVDWAKAPVNRATAIHSESIFSRSVQFHQSGDCCFKVEDTCNR